MARALTEILKEADSATDLKVIIDLWNEIAKNKYKYPLVQIFYANEHVRELSLKVEGDDMAKSHFYYALNEMNKEA